LVKPIEESIKNSFYSKTLRYFELDDSKLIFKKDIDKTILCQVIQKVQKFTKHFLGIQESIIYAKQLSHLECIFDVLTFFPKELTDKITPFWLTELKSNENYFPVITYPIGDMQEYNKFNLNIYLNHKDRALNNKIIENYIESIRRKEESVYEKMCSDKILTRLKEARITLENELYIAKENNDEDLIFEISIISEELQKIEENIPNINFYDDAIAWWPDLLYPVPFVEKFERNEGDVYMLERIRDHYPTLI
jgi:Holliday junction resolvase-like predicted endonuclease